MTKLDSSVDTIVQYVGLAQALKTLGKKDDLEDKMGDAIVTSLQPDKLKEAQQKGASIVTAVTAAKIIQEYRKEYSEDVDMEILEAMMIAMGIKIDFTAIKELLAKKKA